MFGHWKTDLIQRVCSPSGGGLIGFWTTGDIIRDQTLEEKARKRIIYFNIVDVNTNFLINSYRRAGG